MTYLCLFLVLLVFVLVYLCLTLAKIRSKLVSFSEKKVLFKPIKIKGPEFLQNIVKHINKNLLELQAYRAFHLNQLLDERNKFEVLLEIMKDGVILLDDEKRIISYNLKALNMLGIENISDNHNLLNSIKNEKILAGILDFFNKGVDELNINGKFFKFFSTTYQISSIKKTGIAINIRDITLEKEIENMKEDFFQVVTHDLRNPLVVISGYVELLYKKLIHDEDSKKKIGIIMEAIKKLDGMIDDILNFNKLKENKLELRLEKINPYQLVEKVCNEMNAFSVSKNIEIRNLSVDMNVQLSMDVGLMNRVLANLINNAVKYIDGGKSIVLDYDDDKDFITFRVKDDGPGIPKDKISLIFEKYGQLEQHKKRGHGIGLAMCKMAVERHKGRIWVESEVGKGAEFFFTVSKNLT